MPRTRSSTTRARATGLTTQRMPGSGRSHSWRTTWADRTIDLPDKYAPPRRVAYISRKSIPAWPPAQPLLPCETAEEVPERAALTQVVGGVEWVGGCRGLAPRD